MSPELRVSKRLPAEAACERQLIGMRIHPTSLDVENLGGLFRREYAIGDRSGFHEGQYQPTPILDQSKLRSRAVAGPENKGR